MSYRRAWLLVDEINRICGHAAVETQAGGKGGGGTKLTPFGLSATKTSSVLWRRQSARTCVRCVRISANDRNTVFGR
jgi:molybdate transport system regulatory protein